jgi:hypothetical protein
MSANPAEIILRGVPPLFALVGTTDWTRIEPPSSQGLDTRGDLASKQSRKDIVYRRRTAFERPA